MTIKHWNALSDGNECTKSALSPFKIGKFSLIWWILTNRFDKGEFKEKSFIKIFLYK